MKQGASQPPPKKNNRVGFDFTNLNKFSAKNLNAVKINQTNHFIYENSFVFYGEKGYFMKKSNLQTQPKTKQKRKTKIKKSALLLWFLIFLIISSMVFFLNSAKSQSQTQSQSRTQRENNKIAQKILDDFIKNLKIALQDDISFHKKLIDCKSAKYNSMEILGKVDDKCRFQAAFNDKDKDKVKDARSKTLFYDCLLPQDAAKSYAIKVIENDKQCLKSLKNGEIAYHEIPFGDSSIAKFCTVKIKTEN